MGTAGRPHLRAESDRIWLGRLKIVPTSVFYNRELAHGKASAVVDESRTFIASVKANRPYRIGISLFNIPSTTMGKACLRISDEGPAASGGKGRSVLSAGGYVRKVSSQQLAQFGPTRPTFKSVYTGPVISGSGDLRR